MPRLKVLSGQDIISIFKLFNFLVVTQKGSHVKLKRVLAGVSQTLTIPNHKELDKGTIKSILNQGSRYISLEELKEHFYHSN